MQHDQTWWSRSVIGCALATLMTALFVIVVGATAAHAHNAIVGSDPAEGGSVTAGQDGLVLSFQAAVPLDTASVEFVDPATGVRTPAAGLRHGSSTRDVVVGVPAELVGSTSVRWRLVGSDGHVVSGRVPLVVVAATLTPVTTVAGVASSAVPVTAPASVGTSPAAAPGSWSTPAFVGWLARTSSYLALVGLVGILGTAALVWRGVVRLPGVHAAAVGCAVALVALALVQLLLLAADIAGGSPGSDAIGTALRTDVGTALAARAALAAGLAGLLRPMRSEDPSTGGVVVGFGIALLATWAFSGHAWSQRWGVLGVPLDIVHHGAAAVWMGGLAVIGVGALRAGALDEDPQPIVQPFARVAPVAVGLLAATGFAQIVRTTDDLGNLLSDHGRVLAVKLLVVAAMLKVADLNRRRVRRRGTFASSLGLAALRRAMVTEFALGVTVLGITAVMVVTTP